MIRISGKGKRIGVVDGESGDMVGEMILDDWDEKNGKKNGSLYLSLTPKFKT